MLFADASTAYRQTLDPFDGQFPYSAALATVLAALPVVALFYFLVPRRWLAPKAGAAGAAVAIIVAVAAFAMPADKAIWAFVYGAAFGFLPVGWTIFNAMLLYNITVETGQFNIIKRSVASLSADARVQSVLIGFSFGAFLEGAAGGGTPVAICGAIMVGLGFNPFLAAVLCLIANTSPVAFGGLGTPILVLAGVTDLPGTAISTMAGHQLPLLSFVVPLWMTKCMCSWKQTWEVWPALFVAGGSFAVFQYAFATMHDHVPGLVLYPMTDIGGGIFSLVVTAIFLRFWKPKNEWHFDKVEELHTTPIDIDPTDPHAAEAAALLGNGLKVPAHEPKLTLASVSLAWTPFVLMSVLLMATGVVRQMEKTSEPGPGDVFIPGTNIATNYNIPIPTLHEQVFRDGRLDTNGRAERALYNFPWLTSPGSAVFIAAILSMILLLMSPRQIGRVLWRTCVQMKIPIPTIAFMLGLSYVTRYSGMDSTLGYAFSYTGFMYPFFAAILGWLGVFLTGTDAGSNALFGSLQKITANLLHAGGAFGLPDASGVLPANGLTQGQAQVLICTANSTGGVMGKMIDAQSICVATAATHQLGKEADIFKAVVWHSIILAAIVGAITLLQAYVYPFTLMVPHP